MPVAVDIYLDDGGVVTLLREGKEFPETPQPDDVIRLREGDTYRVKSPPVWSEDDDGTIAVISVVVRY